MAQAIRLDAYRDEFRDAPDIFPRLHRDLQVALRSGHPEWVYNDRLHVNIKGRQVVVPVDMRNTQFIGADRRIRCFRLGYEPDILLCLDAYLPAQGVMVDAGANWGYFPVYVAARPEFSGRCLAFEPSERAFHDLEGVVGTLGIGDVVQPIRKALSDSRREACMSDSVWSGLNALSEGGGGQAVRVDALDLTLTELAVTNVDVLKIDVEGEEASVLAGASRTIRSCRPVIVFESWIYPDSAKTLAPLEVLRSIEPSYSFFVLLPSEDSASDLFGGTAMRIEPEDRLALAPRLNIIALPPHRRIERLCSA